jgi:nucleotide-binding universal stress UspA family protein
VNYLRGHGYEVDANPVASRVHPAEVLRIEIADQKIGTLVMGAYGHRGLRELMLGSTTSTLIENPPCALFVYH